MLANSPLILIISSTVLLCSALTAAFLQISMLFFFIYNYIWTKGSNCYIKINQLNFCMIDDIPVVGRYVYLCLLGFSINCQTKLTFFLWFDVLCIVIQQSQIVCVPQLDAASTLHTSQLLLNISNANEWWMINRQSWRTRPISNCTLITLDL